MAIRSVPVLARAELTGVLMVFGVGIKLKLVKRQM